MGTICTNVVSYFRGRLQGTLKARDKSPDDSRISLASSRGYKERKMYKAVDEIRSFREIPLGAAEMGVAIPYPRQE